MPLAKLNSLVASHGFVDKIHALRLPWKVPLALAWPHFQSLPTCTIVSRHIRSFQAHLGVDFLFHNLSLFGKLLLSPSKLSSSTISSQQGRYLSMQLIHISIVKLTHIHLSTSLQSHIFTTPYLLGSIWSWRPCPVFFVSLESSPMPGGAQWMFDEWIYEWTITWSHDSYHKMLYNLVIKTEQIHTNDARPLMLRATCQISETNDQTYSVRGKNSLQL